MNTKQDDIASLIETVTTEDLPHMKGLGGGNGRQPRRGPKLFRCALQLFAERGFEPLRSEIESRKT